MAEPRILHMISPLKHVSPFDVNMALDAGFDAVVPYNQVELGEVTGLVQDAIFSRPPKLGVRSGLFIGGKEAVLALDMLEKARKALVPPFSMSIFADPAGSFTTAAAMVACVERTLREKRQRELSGATIAVFGATGVVGFCSAVIAATEGAKVTLVGHDGPDRVRRASEEIGARFDVGVGFADGSTEERKAAIVAESEIVLAAAKAGVKVLGREQVEAADRLTVAADVNAVPPAGIEGLDVKADGAPLGTHGAVGIGALTIGDIKYKTESGLFRAMIDAEKPVVFDFRDAFRLARSLAARG
ncbi:NAD(P)-dependent methylenetetrahydromethanopterin dehydrogenase [Faunimonas sp. B44]|uniref:NAD(P)-dependent methylenetetrahydromethanopterin dehydrogenase n=1 Tax=Faunimonas sp. B44 TaxID=3461493 RepID=UPI0040443B05